MTETNASRRRLIFAALLLVLFIASLDQTIVSTLKQRAVRRRIARLPLCAF